MQTEKEIADQKAKAEKDRIEAEAKKRETEKETPA
jgi:hypothetical protein